MLVRPSDAPILACWRGPIASRRSAQSDSNRRRGDGQRLRLAAV